MPSNDVRTLLNTAVPTIAAGVIAVGIAAVVSGGKGALGAVVGTLVVILFMGIGLVVLQRTAKAYPHLFQGMGLLLYTAQLLVLFVFMATFKDTTLFDSKVFALTLLATTIVWVAAQARAYMKAKILYVEPEATKGEKPKQTGSST